jgi:hypothetical protein
MGRLEQNERKNNPRQMDKQSLTPVNNIHIGGQCSLLSGGSIG